MTDPSSNVYSTNEEETKHIIVSKYLSQNYSAGVEKLFSTKIEKSEYTITEQKGGMRLHMMCLILTSLTYLNGEETILTCHMKERTWPLQAMNTLRTFLTIKKNIVIVTAKYYPVKISKKLFSASWNNKKKKLNKTSIILHAILNLSLLLLLMYKRKIQIGHWKDDFLQALWKKWLKNIKDVPSNQTNRSTQQLMTGNIFMQETG